VLSVISKVLLLVFVQFATAPIAFTVTQEETNDFFTKALSHQVSEMPLYSRSLFYLINENFLFLCFRRVLLVM